MDDRNGQVDFVYVVRGGLDVVDRGLSVGDVVFTSSGERPVRDRVLDCTL